VGTSWVATSGIMFRILLGRFWCRLQLLWGEFWFNHNSFVFEALFCGSDCLFLYLSLRFCWLFDETFSYCALSSGENWN
jgi:hypothetical protein